MLVKYSRGMWKTIILLVRGGKLPEDAHMPYRRWMERTGALVTAVLSASDRVGISADKRNAIKTKIDGRDMSLETVLKAIAYHAKDEYTYLLKHLTDKSISTIHATNMNDAYALGRFIEVGLITDDGTLVALSNLHKHLEQVPNKNS
ncbi:MAG: hypothetical protein MUE54_02820 [Anaerolineae bacterium]|nr:hypothetical protein [Anaerolineae bacterium]